MKFPDPDHPDRWKTISKTFRTKGEAVRWKDHTLAEVRKTPGYRPPTDQTVGEFLSRWLETMQPPRIRETTFRGYQSKLAHVHRGLGSKSLASITAEDLQRFYGRLGSEEDAHLSAQSIVHVHRVWRLALQSAEDWNLIPKNPARKVTLPKVPKPILHIPTMEESRHLLRTARPHRLYALWVWTALVGCRRSESLGLAWRDIDWENQVARIHQALTGEGSDRELGPVKTRDGYRLVSLAPALIDVLKEHRDRQGAEAAASGSQWRNDDGLVFVAEEGQWLFPSNVERTFKDMLTKAGLPRDIRIHDFRHAMATYWLSKGDPVDVVAHRLGHSDPGFTMRVYGHVQVAQQVAPAARMAEDLLDESVTFPSPGTENTPEI